MASPRNDFPTEVFVARSEMSVSAEALFRWHCRPGAFTDLLPPGDSTTVERLAEIRNGEEMVLRVGVGPLRLRWVSKIYDVVPDRQFRDLQISGPFRFWLHSHLMHPIDDRHSADTSFGLHQASRDRDIVEAAEPLASRREGVMGAAGQIGRSAVAHGRPASVDRRASGAARSFDHVRRPRKPDRALLRRAEPSRDQATDVVGMMG